MRSTRTGIRPACASACGRGWPPSIGVSHQAGQLTQSRRDGDRLRRDLRRAARLLDRSWRRAAQSRRRLPWHRRLEARVAVALALLVAGALGAMLVITIQLVSTQSRTRAEDELDVARTAFSSLMESRAASSIALTTLVTELPVFRAHLTDARLAAGPPHHRRDGRRLSSSARGALRRRHQRRRRVAGEPGLGRMPAHRRRRALGRLLDAARQRDIRRRHRRSRRRAVPGGVGRRRASPTRCWAR